MTKSNSLPKTVIFLDASNIYLSGKKYHNITVKPEKLIAFLSTDKNIIDTYFFSAEDQSYSRQIEFHDMLESTYNIKVFTEPLVYNYVTIRCANPSCNNIIIPRHCEMCGEFFSLPPHKSKRIDISLAVNMLDICSTCEEYIFATGDSDFIPLIRNLRNKKGKKVHLASFKDALSDDYKDDDPMTNKKVIDSIIILDRYLNQII